MDQHIQHVNFVCGNFDDDGGRCSNYMRKLFESIMGGIKIDSLISPAADRSIFKISYMLSQDENNLLYPSTMENIMFNGGDRQYRI